MYIVLGAGSGLGRTVATYISNRTDILVLAGRTAEHLQETRQLILAKNPNVHVAVETVDLKQETTVYDFVERLKSNKTNLRAFINTAAGFYKGELKNQPISSINELLNANYGGVVRLIAVLIKSLNHNVPLDLINITSISSATSLDSSRSSSLHICTKAALHTFGKVLGRELANQGIRITSVAPGTFARKGRNGIREEVIVNIIEFLLDLAPEAWIESIDVRPTLLQKG